MNAMEYLRHVVNVGRTKAAATDEEMKQRGRMFSSFDGFLALYYELAKMEVAMRGDPLEPIRDFAVQKALDRIDTRLDCADFALPGLIRMLMEHRGTERDHVLQFGVPDRPDLPGRRLPVQRHDRAGAP